MANVKNIGFGGASPFDAELADVERRKAFAEGLIQQGSTPIDPNRMAGGLVVPISPLEGLANALKGVVGGYVSKQAAEQERNISEARNQEAKDTLLKAVMASRQGLPGWTNPDTGEQAIAPTEASPEAMAQILMGNPDTAQYGLQTLLAQPEMEMKQKQMEQEAQYRNAMLGLRQQQLAQSGANQAAMMDYRNRALESDAANRAMQLQMQESVRQQNRLYQQDKQDRSEAKDYSSALDKGGLSELVGSVNKAINTIQEAGGPEADLPGYGQTSWLPDFAVSDAGQNLRQDVASIRNAILKARSGGAVTPQEGDRLLQELGEGAAKDDRQLVRGIQNVSRQLNDRLSNLQAGFSPGAIDLYSKRGGAVAPIDASALSAKGAAPVGPKFLGFE